MCSFLLYTELVSRATLTLYCIIILLFTRTWHRVGVYLSFLKTKEVETQRIDIVLYFYCLSAFISRGTVYLLLPLHFESATAHYMQQILTRKCTGFHNLKISWNSRIFVLCMGLWCIRNITLDTAFYIFFWNLIYKVQQYLLK